MSFKLDEIKSIMRNKWKNKLTLTYTLIYILIIIFISIFHPGVLIITFYFLLYPYLFLIKKKEFIYYLLISSVIAIIWVIVGKAQYSYNGNNMYLFGLNVFPLFAWASGLFLAYMIFLYLNTKFKFKTILKKTLLFVAFYWPTLILAETIGYHVFNLNNLTTAMYSGLPICNCIHAPIWMKITYLTLGPLYFIICELVSFKITKSK